MKLTQEQEKIINTDLNIGESLCVEAGAGTGKTTCFVEYSSKRPQSKLLYLCFNNKAAQEAQEKYQTKGITNTTTSTIHGLASKIKHKYTTVGKFSTKVSIKDIEKRFGYSPKLSWLIMETIKNYCYSADKNISKEHVPLIIDQKSKANEILVKESNRVWRSMISLETNTPLSYDHYLKLYHLEGPKLTFDYILLDEAQDSNPLTLDILEKQRASTRTILIGDKNQAIYGWRGAKNAMRSWIPTYHLKLTESFRFGKNIANIANLVLKSYPNKEANPRILGTRETDTVNPSKDNIGNKPNPYGQAGWAGDSRSYTYIARTNSSLFERAIELEKQGYKCHFVNTEEASNYDPTIPYRLDDLKDIYWLWVGQPNKVESSFIKSFKDYHELKKIAVGSTSQNTNPECPLGSELSPTTPPTSKQTKSLFQQTPNGDKELEFLCRMVEKYKHNLPQIVKTIKGQACGPAKSPNDKIITLCTAHRAKGLEWDRVVLAEDFIKLPNNDPTKKHTDVDNFKDLAKELESQEDLQSHIEEINLLYVACTRAKEELVLNKNLSPLYLAQSLDLLNSPAKNRQAPSMPKANTGHSNIQSKLNSPDTLYLTM